MGGHDGAQRPACVDNPETWLAFTDLVLIDPVGTGWSRAAKPDGAQRFLGRAPRFRIDGQGDRALRHQERPRQLAEFRIGEELRRLPCRQGRERFARRDQGIVVTRHPHGLPDG